AMLASIFEWEIDFYKDLRPGDKFTMLVEKKFINDKYAGYGKIIAADFYNQGKLKRAVYYNNGKNKGYYNESGQGLERGFLRVPLNYSRISSRFSSSRLHPVLGYHRPHYGVDYAAPTGTPVKATASGVVQIKSRTKGNGNYIALRHANGYETFYLHLNGFNRAIKKGSRVAQGQIIGYVGSTGYSTGPHLDYRIRKNGTWLNPMKFVATPKTLKKEEIAEFQMFASSYLNKLDMSNTAYVQNSTRISYPPVSSMFLAQF
ncbi:MAG: M23 family metallopeptidase, partial [Mucispirillum sp.]|nr:M23 family metallopeptidase [Mucispirillum sp.]